jgi:transaldolase
MTNKLHDLAALGQSMWYDNIARDLLESGEIQRLVDGGILGMTSNPAIFKSAITTGSAYDQQLTELAGKGLTPVQVYEALAIRDIRAAADILRPVFDRTGGVDGYVSLEVSPFLAHDTTGTTAEAKRLFKEVSRPNVMIKIPATPEGLPAIEECIAAGLNINVTLIFSRDLYARVMDAYIKGLERRAAAEQPVGNIASVASFFVSRVDSLVDRLLDDKIAAGGDSPVLNALKGKAAYGNAKLAYQLYKEVFQSPRFRTLEDKGAWVQRPLWASTSTKDPSYPDTIYVDTLIGPDTVNTAPPNTIDAFIDHGIVALTLEEGVDEARRVEADLEEVGITMQAVTVMLLSDGVAKFALPFQELLTAIETKQMQLTTA